MVHEIEDLGMKNNVISIEPFLTKDLWKKIFDSLSDSDCQYNGSIEIHVNTINQTLDLIAFSSDEEETITTSIDLERAVKLRDALNEFIKDCEK